MRKFGIYYEDKEVNWFYTPDEAYTAASDHCQQTGQFLTVKEIKEDDATIEQWKELFFLLKNDFELLENFQTGEWVEKAKELGIDVSGYE